MHARTDLAPRCWVLMFLRGRNGVSVMMMLTMARGLQESGKEVDMLNEERGQKVNKLKIVEKERANLGSAKEEAEEFMSLQRKLVIKKSVLYQVRTLSQNNVGMHVHHYRHLICSHRGSLFAHIECLLCWNWWSGAQLHLKDTGEELKALTEKHTTLDAKLVHEKEKVAEISKQVWRMMEFFWAVCIE